VPVLNALALLEISPFGTYLAQVQMPNKRKYIDSLMQIATELGGCAEDWSTSLRLLCRACSEGRPHKEHDTEAAPPKGAHTIGIAALDRKHAIKILRKWGSGLDDVKVESLNDVL
jgi:hypothetical protein